MSNRPSSRGGVGMAGRGPGGVLPPGTATRLTTGMAGARPGTRGGNVGGGVALASDLQVADRPMTRQGLGGLKTAGQGPQRQVQDKTYFLGLLRTKINELSSEIQSVKHNIHNMSEDQSSYVTYEKRAESLAAEIRSLQAELGDYNTLVDKLTTDESIADIQMEYEDLKAANDRNTSAIDALFEQKQQSETVIKQLEVELQQERDLTHNLVADMNSNMREKYKKMKDLNEHLLRQLETDQQELDRLTMKKAELEDELAMSPVKQEAVRLYEQLHELEEKRDQLLEEQREKGSPQQERETLLKQVKENNQEIASIERQTNELREKIALLQEEGQQLDIDIEENQGERNQKYRDLKKREETMDEFLNGFEDSKRQEQDKITQLEQNSVLILEHISKNLARFHHLPTSKELHVMKEDLSFKAGEMEKSKSTASGLAADSQKLQEDLMKVEQLEAKISTELDTLRTSIVSMEEELVVYSDIDRLKTEAEQRKKKLSEDRVTLLRRRDTFKKVLQQMSTQYDALKAQLNDNETFTQLGNLERKWQHNEQNNFVMKEFIATKMQESDFRPLARRVQHMIGDYNKHLQENAGKSNY